MSKRIPLPPELEAQRISPQTNRRADAAWVASRALPYGECLLWTGATGHFGYGVVGRKQRLAHRIAYEGAYGPIPDGMHIDHLCRRPKCVNPVHLEAVTPRENAMRRHGAINTPPGQCSRGHDVSDPSNQLLDGSYTRCKTCVNARRRRRWNWNREPALNEPIDPSYPPPNPERPGLALLAVPPAGR